MKSAPMITILQRDAKALGVSLSGEQLRQCQTYCDLLIHHNRFLGLTTITEPESIAVRHFADSLTLLAGAEIPEGAALIDVGTGAGFPGMALKIARPDLDVTLLDSLQKRLQFLHTVSRTLEVPVTLVHARAEDAGRLPELRERFDVVTARAVASLPVLLEYCLPFARVGGKLIAMKGPDIRQEREASKHALEALCGAWSATQSFILSDGSRRTLLAVEKTAATPAGYPRSPGKIKKKVL